MARRRRAVRKNTRGKSSPRRPVKRSKNKTLKERFLTTAIWGLSLINITLIFSLLSNFFASEGETALSARVTPEEPPVKIITVQVLNGCGVQGLANEITQYLRNKNFDVVDVGNYEGGYLDQTLVLDRVSLESKYAKKVAKALGVNEKLVTPTLEKSLQLMVTVIIGRDYKKLKIYRELQN